MTSQSEGKPAGTAGAAGPNECTPSTTWEWRKVKVRRAAQPPQEQRAAGAPLITSRWNPREKITLTVRSRGGRECWLEIKARGQTFRVPGHLCVLDVMMRIWG